MKLLLTAFDPFGGAEINPAQKAAEAVRAPAGVKIVRLLVPTVFRTAAQTVNQAIDREKPDAVLCVGQAGGRDAVTPERVAINLMDAAAADNAGQMPVDQPVIEGGENALFVTLPAKAMAEAIRQAGIPARVSCSAGTFVCNSLLYGVLYHCRQSRNAVRAGFIHLPFLPEQTAGRPELPAMPLEQMVRALEIAIEVIDRHLKAENGGINHGICQA